MKRIGLDVRMVRNSGIGTTIRGLLDHSTPEQKWRLLLFGNDPVSTDSECAYTQVSYPIYSLRQHWSYGHFLNQQDLALFHMPHYDVPLSYSGPLIVTVHDLIHYLFPAYSTKPLTRLYSGFLLRHVAKRAARIIVDSKSTGADLARFFPRAEPKIRVIYPGIDPTFAPPSSAMVDQVLAHHRLKSGYILYVGNLRESKNTRGLVNAYLSLRRENTALPPLVLAGSNSLKGFDSAALLPDVRYLGPVSADHLVPLYAGAEMFVFPSFYEGFGLPPIEAMACGTPVIASNAGSLPEVCGAAALYVDPHAESDIARAIAALHASAERRTDLRSKGLAQAKRYSWRTFAKETWEVYEDVLKETHV